jgi:hypothetical protein
MVAESQFPRFEIETTLFLLSHPQIFRPIFSRFRESQKVSTDNFLLLQKTNGKSSPDAKLYDKDRFRTLRRTYLCRLSLKKQHFAKIREL